MEKIVPISSIIIRDRYRKDVGDLGPLGQSLENTGFIHLPVVTSAMELVCGERRVKAWEKLGHKDIEVRVIDPDDMLLAERDENTLRKDFTESERVAICRTIEKRMGERRGRPAANGDAKEIVGNCPQFSPGEKTRDVAAKASGFRSTDAYRRAANVVDDGIPELAEEMDSGALSVSTAALIANLPPEEQAAIIKAGPAAARAFATETRNARKPKKAIVPSDKKAMPKKFQTVPDPGPLSGDRAEELLFECLATARKRFFASVKPALESIGVDSNYAKMLIALMNYAPKPKPKKGA